MSYYLSINSDISFFGEKVPSQKILPSHRTSLSSLIGKHLFNLAGIQEYLAQSKQGFRFAIGKDCSQLDAGSAARRMISNGSCAGMKQINRIGRYYQNLGYVSRPGLSKDRLFANTAAAALVKSQKAPAGLKSKFYSAIKFSENILSFIRDGLKLSPDFGPEHAFVSNYGYAAGSVWSFFAFKELLDGITDLDKARQIGDFEGARRATARISSGFATMNASSLYIAAKILDGASSFETAAAAVGHASNALFGVGAIIGMGMAGLGIYRCSRFTARIDEYLDNPDPNLAKGEKLKGALRFLKDAMSVTFEERRELFQKIEKEQREETPERRRELYKQAVDRLAETKLKYMKRRTTHAGLASLLDSRNGVDALLDRLESGDETAVQDAENLVSFIKKQNLKKMGFYFLYFIASLVGFVGVVAGTFVTGGALPFALLGISAGLFAFLTGYNFYKSIKGSSSDAQSGINLQPLNSQ